jgi:hypothetical protein
MNGVSALLVGDLCRRCGALPCQGMLPDDRLPTPKPGSARVPAPPHRSRRIGDCTRLTLRDLTTYWAARWRGRGTRGRRHIVPGRHAIPQP